MKGNSGDRRALSIALSQAANATVAQALEVPENPVGACRRVGITGPPGVGKSSLIASLVAHRLGQAGDIAIAAIDPSSPVSGGALLGDRIRMENLADESRVFIRSFASRSSLDGLAANLPVILQVFENGGFTELIVETVGVGQVDYAVRNLVDTMVLVLMPGMGDQIQTMKGGILEAADIYVINKADMPGASQLASGLRMIVNRHTYHPEDWTPVIIATSSGDESSIGDLSAAINAHQRWLTEKSGGSGAGLRRRGYHIGSLISRRVAELMHALPPETLGQPLADLYRTVIKLLEAELNTDDACARSAP